MVDFHANRKAASVPESAVPAESGEDDPDASNAEGNLLARQIVALDGVTYAQAQQQIREMMGLDLSVYDLPRAEPSINGRAHDGRSSNDGADEIVRQLREQRKIVAIPTILDLLCNTTGMRFAAIARNADVRWTSRGPREEGKLGVSSRLHIESEDAEISIVLDPSKPQQHPLHTPRLDGAEGYISVPIVEAGGRYFGNLCAIGPSTSTVADPRIVSLFNAFAQIIAQQLEDELSRKAQQDILSDERAVSELREEFIAILGHDLRNPLHAILASASILERRLDESGLVNMASRIKTNARRMSALIDDVTDFARGRLGSGIGVNIRDVDDLAAGLTAVVRELQDANPDRQIDTDICILGQVQCDKARVQQMASNLVANALTHGSAQHPIRVTARDVEGYVTFTVSNDGEPIPASSIDKVFQPFWRDSISTNRQGLGLGLYICSQIVRAHAGILSVTSTRENGTVFKVRLPVRATPK